jgi:hypothetical protein
MHIRMAQLFGGEANACTLEIGHASRKRKRTGPGGIFQESHNLYPHRE